MKTLFASLLAITLLTGCAHDHEGGVSDRSYQETGGMRSGPPVQTQMDRDFPGRTGPGMTRPFDPAIPR